MGHIGSLFLKHPYGIRSWHWQQHFFAAVLTMRGVVALTALTDIVLVIILIVTMIPQAILKIGL